MLYILTIRLYIYFQISDLQPYYIKTILVQRDHAIYSKYLKQYL